MASKTISASREISAPASELFSVVADASKHPLFDGSGTVLEATGQPEPLKMGSKFAMSMKLFVPYKITNKVVEFEQDKLIAWCHPGRHRWRYEFEAVDDSTTLVTETFDWAPAPLGKLYELMGLPRKHLTEMEKTLQNLEELVTNDG